jgi:hypothetical protein
MTRLRHLLALAFVFVLLAAIAPCASASHTTGQSSGEPRLKVDIENDGNLLYDNGPLITHHGTGPGGADESVTQNLSLGMTTNGMNVKSPTYRMADDFEITGLDGWHIKRIVFYAYQTNSGTSSTFTSVNYRIWNGAPGDPASRVIYGDTTTNRLEATGWASIYRRMENAPGNTDRPVMYIYGEAGVDLGPGSYWLDWQLSGTLTSGPWQPPITILSQATTGNALHWNGSSWSSAVDDGSQTALGMPFEIWGAITPARPASNWVFLPIVMKQHPVPTPTRTPTPTVTRTATRTPTRTPTRQPDGVVGWFESCDTGEETNTFGLDETCVEFWMSASSYPNLKGVSWRDNLGAPSPICPNMTSCTPSRTYYNIYTGLPTYYVFYYYIAGQNRALGQYEVRAIDKYDVWFGSNHFQIVAEVTGMSP